MSENQPPEEAGAPEAAGSPYAPPPASPPPAAEREDPHELPEGVFLEPEEATANLTEDECMWGMLAHLSCFSSILIPFGNLLGPFIVWQVKKDESEYVVAHAKEALNFQLSLTIYSSVTAILMFILFFVFFIGLLLIPVLIAMVIFGLVQTIIAGLRANEGKFHEYPLTLRLIT